jgi:hypothetical protein
MRKAISRRIKKKRMVLPVMLIRHSVVLFFNTFMKLVVKTSNLMMRKQKKIIKIKTLKSTQTRVKKKTRNNKQSRKRRLRGSERKVTV